MADKKASFEDMSFREGMTQLEDIVRTLESGSLELEESLEKYAVGVALLAELQKRLNEAQQKVDVLMGELEEAPEDDIQDSTLSKA